MGSNRDTHQVHRAGDITEGIDRHDYSGLIEERTRHRAGVIKVATGYGEITSWEEKALQAAAIASIETGSPSIPTPPRAPARWNKRSGC